MIGGNLKKTKQKTKTKQNEKYNYHEAPIVNYLKANLKKK